MREAAAKADLMGLEQRLDERIGKLEARVDARIDPLEDRLKDHMRDSETSLLTAFHSYAHSNDLRLRKVEGDLQNFNTGETLRLAAIENRLLAVEQKVQTPGRS